MPRKGETGIRKGIKLLHKGNRAVLLHAEVREIVHESGLRVSKDAVKFAVDQSEHNHDHFKWEWIVARAAHDVDLEGERATVHVRDLQLAQADFAIMPRAKLHPRGQGDPAFGTYSRGNPALKERWEREFTKIRGREGR